MNISTPCEILASNYARLAMLREDKSKTLNLNLQEWLTVTYGMKNNPLILEMDET